MGRSLACLESTLSLNQKYGMATGRKGNLPVLNRLWYKVQSLSYPGESPRTG